MIFKFVIVISFFAFVISLAILVYVWYRLREGVVLHTNSNDKLISQYQIEGERMQVNTSDGVIISALYHKAQKPKAVVILLHGYTTKNGSGALMLPHTQYLLKEGYSIVIPDFRSTGKSGGNKIFLGTREHKDAKAVYDMMRSLPENQGVFIGFFGISMGGSVALSTAGKEKIGDFVIAAVPYKSLASQLKFQLRKEGFPVQLMFPFLHLAAMFEFGLDYDASSPERVIKNIRQPVFIMVANKDGDVDYRDGLSLFEELTAKKYLWKADTQHDIFDEQPVIFKQKVLHFLAEVVQNKM